MEPDQPIHRLIRCRFIDDRHVLVHVQSNIFLIKGLGCQIAIFMVSTVSIAISEIKNLNGLSEGNASGFVDFLHHFQLPRIWVFSCQDQFPQFHGIFSQKLIECSYKMVCVFRLIRFGLHLFGHDAVFFYQVCRFTPISAVAHAAQDILHALAFEGFIGMIDDHLEEIIGLFQFVIKGQVILGQFKFIQVATFCHDFSQYIEGCKKPATARFLLGRDSSRLDFYRKSTFEPCRRAGHIRKACHVCFGKGRMKDRSCRVHLIGRAELLQYICRNRFHTIAPHLSVNCIRKHSFPIGHCTTPGALWRYRCSSLAIAFNYILCLFSKQVISAILIS